MCKLRLLHWNENVTLMKFSSLLALEVVRMITSSVNSEENFIKNMTFCFQFILGVLLLCTQLMEYHGDSNFWQLWKFGNYGECNHEKWESTGGNLWLSRIIHDLCGFYTEKLFTKPPSKEFLAYKLLYRVTKHLPQDLIRAIVWQSMLMMMYLYRNNNKTNSLSCTKIWEVALWPR